MNGRLLLAQGHITIARQTSAAKCHAMPTIPNHRLRPLMRYLETHYANPPTLAEAARRVALSPWHFHRLFREHTGETYAAHLRRLRLEAVARKLFYDDHASITTLALEHGFASSQALAKAFRRHFGFPPSQLRHCHSVESIITTMQQSKIGHLLHKTGHAQNPPAADNKRSPPQPEHTMQTEKLSPCTVAYIRVTGPYGEGYEEATNTLYQWAGAHNLANGECLFIYLDNPETTPATQCRTDICLTVPEDAPVHGRIEKRALPGGSYATLRRTVTDPAQYRQYWQEAIAALLAAGLAIDDGRPCFERYHHYDTQTGHADVSFCTAITAG
ncbi:MAG: AraC family transcriptional regulator [Cardiobacteriaceae bacterium]|nr:AraC family transcriptional regulator [Cardiobacteriaceae bacterium]